MYDLFEHLRAELEKESGESRKRWSQQDYLDSLKSLTDAQLNFNFQYITRRMLISPAFRILTPRAVKLLLLCINASWYKSDKNSNRRNIGKHAMGKVETVKPQKFMLPYNFIKCFGISSHDQIHKAFEELKAFKFLKLVRDGKQRQPNVYQLINKYQVLSDSDVLEIKSRLRK